MILGVSIKKQKGQSMKKICKAPRVEDIVAGMVRIE